MGSAQGQLLLGSVREDLQTWTLLTRDGAPGCMLLTQSEPVEFPGSEETTDVTFPEAHHIRALAQLPLSPPPLCPALSLVSSLLLPEPPIEKKMNGRRQEDKGQPCSSSRLDSLGKWCSHALPQPPLRTEPQRYRSGPFPQPPVQANASCPHCPGENPPAIQTPLASPPPSIASFRLAWFFQSTAPVESLQLKSLLGLYGI